MAVRERIEHGENPADAEANARREFGNATLVKEVTRDMWGWRWLETFLQDLRYGLRQLHRNPGFTAVAVLTLALGIGANTAMFSVVNAALLRPLPFHDPGRLVAIEGIPAVRIAYFNGSPNWIAGWEDWVGKTRTLTAVSIYDTAGVNLAGGEQPEHLPAAAVSANFFRLLGVGPVRGRTFLPQEDRPGHAVAVISYDLWRGRFAADRGIVGKPIELAGRPFTVIGVMPGGFEFPGDTQIWVPSQANVAVMLFGQQAVAIREVARLRPGITPEQVRSELVVFLRHMNHGHARPFNSELRVTPLRLELVKDIRPALLLLMGAVGLVLLIACADMANLLMARNAGRRQELAVRAAMGAGRQRLLRQLLTESLLLSLSGGAAGLAVGAAGVHLARALTSASLMSTQGVQLDGWVLIFTLAVAVVTGITSGLLPAFGGSKVVLAEALKEAAGRSEPSLGFSGGHRLRTGLGSLEVALAFILLIGSSLLMESLFSLSDVNPGFRSHHLLTARLFLTGPAYKPSHGKQRTAFYEQVLNRIRALHGAREAAFVSSLPLGGGVSVMYSVGLKGTPSANPESSGKWAIYCRVSPDYFRAMGIPLLEGRAFSELDRSGSPQVVVVSRTMARRFWPGQDAVGKRITMFGPPQWMTVVGIVGDVRHWGLAEQPNPEMYIPLLQAPPQSAFLVVHNVGPLSAADVGRVVRGVDPAEPVAFVHTVQELLSIRTAGPRFRADVLGIFAGLAVLLALIGVYGVISYAVARRTHEIGIRMALGAQHSDLLWLVIRQGITLAVVGLSVGIVGALAVTRLLSSLLYGVNPSDPLTFALVSLILTGAVLLATYIPARRATRVDPMVALRHE
jgi:putative ABC transport system permease protein